MVYYLLQTQVTFSNAPEKHRCHCYVMTKNNLFRIIIINYDYGICKIFLYFNYEVSICLNPSSFPRQQKMGIQD